MKDKITATITDIQTNEKTGVSIVGVKIKLGEKELIKAYQINHSTDSVSFEEFKIKLVELVKEELDKEEKKRDIIDEIIKHKGVPFELNIIGDNPQLKEV